MLLFASDIDNTLIYSHKKTIAGEKIPCELYRRENISFITKNTRQKLDYINENALFIPVTTRSIEQYLRINLSNFTPKYAICSNGGNLLINGKICKEWQNDFLQNTEEAVPGLEKGYKLLEQDNNRSMDVRWVDNLFIYTKSDNVEYSAEKLQEKLYNENVDVYHFSNKVYVVPKVLSKGNALKKFIKEYGKDINIVVSAGDSMFDKSLLSAADYAIYPENLDLSLNVKTIKISIDEIFAEKVVENVIKLIT